MKLDFLLEIGTEEIPARMAPPAARQLGELFAKEMDNLLVETGPVSVFATPRRLVLIAREVPVRQPDRVEQRVGPAKQVAFDAEGRPTKAGEGFARGQGVDPSALELMATPKGEYVCVHKKIEGQALAPLLAELLPRLIGRLHFPKSMRWGREPVAFVRPVHWIVALLGDEVVPLRFAGVDSGAESRGHRFLAPAPFPVHGVDGYLAELAGRHVVLDPAERRRRIVASLADLAGQAGGALVENEALLEEVTNLVEEPTTTLGRFDEAYLEIPKEVLISAMAKHQRYFAFARPDGRLSNAFAVVSNTAAENMATVTRGNERVLRARLDDARFFFGEDRKRPLADYVEGLAQRVFLKPLGTMRDKAARITELSRRLATLLAPAAEETAARAALLAKADLPTQVVGEFPDLQGVMGREYALLSGEPEAVANAIFEHYLPRSAEDELPATDAGAIVALADKADSIVGCFGVGLTPSATQDPYALRRQALGIIRILDERGWTLPLAAIVAPAIKAYAGNLHKEPGELAASVLDFFAGRLRFWLMQSHPTDVVDAVLAVDATRIPDAVAKVAALTALRGRADFEPLAATFKRVGNITKDLAPESLTAANLQAEAEKALHAAHVEIGDRVRALVARRAFDEALAAVTELGPFVNAFFDQVMVMAEDEALRHNRVALLQGVSETFRLIAEFGRIHVEKS